MTDLDVNNHGKGEQDQAQQILQPLAQGNVTANQVATDLSLDQENASDLLRELADEYDSTPSAASLLSDRWVSYLIVALRRQGAEVVIEDDGETATLEVACNAMTPSTIDVIIEKIRQCDKSGALNISIKRKQPINMHDVPDSQQVISAPILNAAERAIKKAISRWDSALNCATGKEDIANLEQEFAVAQSAIRRHLSLIRDHNGDQLPTAELRELSHQFASA